MAAERVLAIVSNHLIIIVAESDLIFLRSNDLTPPRRHCLMVRLSPPLRPPFGASFCSHTSLLRIAGVLNGEVYGKLKVSTSATNLKMCQTDLEISVSV